MRKMIRVCVITLGVIFVAVLITVLLYALCIYQQRANMPVRQSFTKWASEDGRIVFETDANGAGFGTMVVEGESLDIYFATGFGDIGVYVITEEGRTELIEMWAGYFYRADRFVAVVSDKTTYYEKGERITFYRE